MKVIVKGKNLDVPEHVKQEAVAKLTKVTRLYDHFLDMEVVFFEDRNPRIAEPIHCEVVLHAKGKAFHAQSAGADHATAVARTEAKLERQVRKFKTKLLSRRNDGPDPTAPPPGSVLHDDFDDEDLDEDVLVGVFGDE